MGELEPNSQPESQNYGIDNKTHWNTRIPDWSGYQFVTAEKYLLAASVMRRY